MLWLRKFLLWIRDKKNENASKLYLQSGLVFVLVSALSVGIDILLPFEDYWIFVRSAFLIPIGLAAFVFVYAFALQRGEALLRSHTDHIPYRLRWSSKWRRNLSLIVAAFMAVLVYAIDYFVGYTIMASLVVTAVVGMLAFCRLTQREAHRLEMDIPDPRDTQFEARIERKRAENARKLREQEESDEDENQTAEKSTENN